MNNHKIYNSIKNEIIYKTLIYTSDDDNDSKFINKFIIKNNYCIIIQRNYSYIAKYNSHPYYNPEIPLSKTTYYNNQKIIYEFIETPESIKLKAKKEARKEKLEKLNEI